MRWSLTEKQRRIFFSSIFIGVGLLLYPVYKYQINPDGIAYLSIAQHYGRGDWMSALNSCWPPMLSWLLAPWTLTGIEPLWIFKIYNIITGAACLWVGHRLLLLYRLSLTAEIAGMALLFVTFMMWVFSITTPDLMSVLLMLIYALMIINGNYLHKPVVLGVVGALAYFTKSYCFFFFAAHLCFQYGMLLLRKRGPVGFLAKRFFTTALVFASLSLAWMILLYQKYDVFTISSASAYTHGMLKYPNLACMNSFLPPPNTNAVFAWEDPPLVCEHQDWSMFASSDNFFFQLKTIVKNTATLFRMQVLTGYFHLLGFVLMLVALIVKRKERWKMKSANEILDDPLFSLFPMIIIYSFGYLLIFIEPRYVWFGYALITIGTVAALDRLLSYLQINKRNAVMLISLAVLLSAGAILYKQPRLIAPLKRVFSKESGQHNTYDFYHQTMELSGQIPQGSRMANWGIYSGQLRSQSSSFAYFTKGHHYGLLPDSSSLAMSLINTHDIDVVIMDKASGNLPVFLLSGWKKLEPQPGSLVVYQRLTSAK
jgi:hypothetical protein